jgi:hypothetical protein
MAGLRVERDVCYHPQPEGACIEQSLDIYSHQPQQASASRRLMPDN